MLNIKLLASLFVSVSASSLVAMWQDPNEGHDRKFTPSHQVNYGSQGSHSVNYGSHNVNYGSQGSHSVNYGSQGSHSVNYGSHNVNYGSQGVTA
ncbi:hypothetical protein Bealeia1_01069 [Candidatus Bealeia paramacronuclearis]|uniref:Uncharacterized protein n=1 Tax=Candidatus Bealeia paramacronuclearis TaxID=1921001 RepID=A0ABZ2C398_9PROT